MAASFGLISRLSKVISMSICRYGIQIAPSLAKAEFPSVSHQISTLATRLAQVRNPTVLYSMLHCNLTDYGGTNWIFPDPGTVAHDESIKKGCASTVEAASQLLVHALLDVLTINERYRDAVKTLMELMLETMQVSHDEEHQQQLADMIIAARGEVFDAKKKLLDLHILIDGVIRMATSVAETAYLAGSEDVSTVMCERLTSGLAVIDEEKEKTVQLDKEFVKFEEWYIYQSSEKFLKKSTCNS